MNTGKVPGAARKHGGIVMVDTAIEATEVSTVVNKLQLVLSSQSRQPKTLLEESADEITRHGCAGNLLVQEAQTAVEVDAGLQTDEVEGEAS